MSHIRIDLPIQSNLNQSRLDDEPTLASAPHTLWQRIVAYFVERAERRAARIALAGLDDRTLHDIGLTRPMVEFELSQPVRCPVVDRR
jgi:uncharacterized protein YjiS (DUF1127 family)